MGWAAGEYEYGSVYRLCMSIAGCLWIEGAYKHGSVQATYVGYKFFNNVTKDVTIHLRITTMSIIGSVRFKYCYAWVYYFVLSTKSIEE